MTSAIYASLSAFLIVWLSLNVIKVRRTKQVSVGDGGDAELKTAMAAQSNALEYLPISLLLLFALEYNGAFLVLVHSLGVLLLVGRVIHARAMLTSHLKRRVLGMQITIWVLIGLALANLIFIPYGKLVPV
ncbi:MULTISPECIES: MAPEG family protein [unclassified Thiocapsa]|uniref:MAPEG family protein n=1 Tax=unclassified Thiocapsa TaxID=2641286 RepID=UPI0035AE953A